MKIPNHPVFPHTPDPDERRDVAVADELIEAAEGQHQRVTLEFCEKVIRAERNSGSRDYPPHPMTTGIIFNHVWHWRARLPHRKGQPCAIIHRGPMNSALVAFEDGSKVVTSRYAVRKQRIN